MKKTYIRVALIILSVALIVTGLYRGETAEILRKAVMICLQCIGIG
ncbi:MAG: hypothetical protein IJK13_00735 [Lachnospiraceae bacterium]|nr:hypothetical protein [Lachnospiraceae bacterium]MBR0434515.1 hypothetical protein [Lachnospiraceae bacterium]